ncbi:uncharacterized protein LOC135441836 [Zonotrichia leucophrys gambelii]|uniref:uncharacterized protein LOC135441836 n=1 Tax=Zonotrichia leucophrys gambelii TaxID=257770 RepID=UPI00313FF5B7
MGELGQALGGEEGAEVVARYKAWVRREAMVAASEATRATMERQRVEAALGLLERLVAACDEATAFPRELQCLLRDIEATLKGTNEASPDVPEDLVAKVAVAEQLWEANARLATHHLVGTLPDIIKLLFTGGPDCPSACGVAERCQRAIEDIPSLLRPLEHLEGIPKVSPVSMEPQELSPAVLLPQVTVVAILGELLDTLPSRAEMMQPWSPFSLHWDLVRFTEDLQVTLHCTDDTWWCHNVTSNDDDPLTSLSQALAAYKSTPGTARNRVTMAASKWRQSVSVLVYKWVCLGRQATHLPYACRKVLTEAATATSRARELQDEAARDGTAQENMVELGQALGREEGAEVVAGHGAQLSPALLQPQVTTVAILDKLLATLPRRDKMMLVSTVSLYWDLVDFTENLRVTLYCIDDTWWHCNVTSDDDDDDPVTSLSQALATYKSNPQTTQNHVTMAASKWLRSVSVLVDRSTELARAATKLRNTCRQVLMEAAKEAATATAHARKLQDTAACYGTAQENMGELGEALSREEGAEVMSRYKAQVRREARLAASEATRATMVRQRLETALGLLERLVATCDEATALPRELQRRVGDIEAALKGTNEASTNVPEDLVAKVAMAEWLLEANACLVKDHLLGTLPDITKFYINGAPTSPSACEVAERCQRAIKDIPRLLRSPQHLSSVPKVSPVSKELQELSLALLQTQVTVVAILGQLLATLPCQDEMMQLLESPGCLYSVLANFVMELWSTMLDTEGIWWRCIFSFHGDDDPLTSLSWALAAWESTPWTTWDHVTWTASKWQWSVANLVDSWAERARAATKIRNTWREMAAEGANMVATFTILASELHAKAARYGTAQENMVELRQALGREEGAEVVARHGAQVRREARVAASQAARATKRRQRVQVALGLLEGLVAACDKATTLLRELQRRVGEIEATLKGTNEASTNVSEDLVAKVTEAEWLWEANARLAKDHLAETLEDIIRFYFDDDSAVPSARGVAERCQRAIKDIPRLLRPLAHPQRIPAGSPVSMELQKLSPGPLLSPQVTVVAILGELVATLPRREEEMLVFMSPGCPYWDLENFTNELWVTLYRIDDSWWRRNVTSNDDGPVTSLSQALATYKSTPGTTWDKVTMAASAWQWSVSVLVDSWAKLARKATKLRNVCRDLATKAAKKAATATAWARERQDEAARDGTAQENMEELGVRGQGREEEAEVESGYEAWMREEAMEAASKPTAFPRELQRRVRDIEATLWGTNEASPDVPEDLVAKSVAPVGCPQPLLQPQVTVVAILGELLATLRSKDEMILLVSTVSLYWDLVDFNKNLRATLYRTDDTWWHRKVTSNDNDPLTSLSQVLAAYQSTPWTTQDHVTMVAGQWLQLVGALVDSWARLARAATKLHNTCTEAATEAALTNEDSVAKVFGWRPTG